MLKHRFAVGQKVRFRTSLERLSYPDAAYEVVRLLPPIGEGVPETFQYLLREAAGAHFRTAREDHLDNVQPPTAINEACRRPSASPFARR